MLHIVVGSLTTLPLILQTTHLLLSALSNSVAKATHLPLVPSWYGLDCLGLGHLGRWP